MLRKQFIWVVVLLLILTPSLWAQFKLLHVFSGTASDGGNPLGSLIVKGSTLYGMTYGGGAFNTGAVFKININGTGFRVLHSFVGGASDGLTPYGSLVLYGSTLYGMTPYGGASDNGTIFKINIDGTGFRVLHLFAGGASDGARPWGALTLVGTTLYGMTESGGAGGMGIVFKIKLNGTGFQLLHTFAGGPDGAYPRGSLKYAGTKLYGMTWQGGTSGEGTVFTISPGGTGYSVLHSFSLSALDGAGPRYGTLAAANSVLYGMTFNGGVLGLGVVFKINTNGTGFSVLHSFTGTASNGSYPMGGLILVGTKLYGMTNDGGSGTLGTIFRINVNGTGFELLHSFLSGATDGASPTGSLLRKVSTTYGDRLYGMTYYGGDYGLGTIFSYKLK